MTERTGDLALPSAGTRGLAAERLRCTLGIYPMVLVETDPRSGSVLGAHVHG